MEKKKYYSYKTFHPEEIHGGIYRTVNGDFFNDLDLLSDAELEELGFHLIELPEGYYKIKNGGGKYPPQEYWTYSYTWYRPTSEFIISERTIEDIKRMIDYERFWNDFSETSAYDKIREQSMISLPVNTVATELISLFSEATKSFEKVKESRIQNCLNFIFANIEFTSEELQEIQEIFVGTGMNYQYTIQLPNAG